MEIKLNKRIEQLKNEYVSGQQKLMELEAQARTLRENLYRVSGAIQVLEEEMRTGVEKNKEEPVEQEPVTAMVE